MQNNGAYDECDIALGGQSTLRTGGSGTISHLEWQVVSGLSGH